MAEQTSPGKRSRSRTLAPESDLEAALRRSESRFQWLVARAGYGVCEFRSTGEIVAVNHALAQILGVASAADAVGLDLVRDVLTDPAELQALVAGGDETRDGGWSSARWRRRDGSTINVRVAVLPASTGADGSAVHEAIVDDVTERKRQEELLRRTERMASLGTTLAGVAHELNNPLAAIMGFVQLLLKKPWPAEDLAALETVNHEAIRSASIVRDLLAIARRRDVERRAATDVNEVIGYIVRTRRYALQAAGIDCQVEAAPALPLVLADRAQLEQVILNLLSNAEDALRAHFDAATGGSAGTDRRDAARIVLRTRRDADDVVIEVDDNGPGIPPNLESQIWDPFWTTKQEGEGTGLGLAVAHAIVSEHGGSISAETAADGGARFVVRLPVAKDHAPPAPAGQASRALDVLIVDPGASDLLFVERFLTRRGHAVLNAGSGELAARLAQQSTFDAVVCDARLRDRDGVLVAERLYDSPGCGRARFILSSLEPVDRSRLPSGLRQVPCVARPYEVEELRRLIEGE